MYLISKFLLTLTAVCSVAVMSCKMQKPATGNTDQEVPKLIVDDSWSQPDDMVSVDISKVEITDDILTIAVSYSGGCEEHEFRLYFNGMYMKSLPPKANFVLYHDNKGDACRSIVEKTLKFDITGVREKGKTTGEVMVKVVGFETALSYKY